MGQTDVSDRAGGIRGGKASWEAVVSAVVGVGSLLLGICTWWGGSNSKSDDRRPEPKIVVVPAAAASPAPPTAANAADEAPTEAATDSVFTAHALKLSNRQSIQYYRNLALNEVHPHVDRAVIVVHAHHAEKQADLLRTLIEQARAGGRERSTLIVVPEFPTSEKHARKGEPYWGKAWETGTQSSGDDSISTFKVVDEIIAQVTDPAHFPDLRTVVVAGMGLGGTFVNRYIAGGRPMVAPGHERPVAVEYVVINAYSYLYMDRMRPVPGTDEFKEPDASACPDFNQYRYGVQGRNAYMNLSTTAVLRANMFGRRATYIAGECDTELAHRDQNAASLLQGKTRFERAVNYKNYVQRFPEWKKNAEFRLVRVAERSSPLTYDAKEVRAALFGTAAGLASVAPASEAIAKRGDAR